MIEFIAAYVSLSSDRIERDRLDDRVMKAMACVPRHQYVPDQLQRFAYMDSPLPIGCGKTISQPFMVALMTDLLELRETDRVLDVGTGLGYQTAILAELAAEIFTIEILEELATDARVRLQEAGYRNINFRIGDGAHGWAEHAPYDKIMVTAAPDLMPPALLQQLKPGGTMVIPAGMEDDQKLLVVEKDAGGRLQTRETIPVRFSRLISPRARPLRAGFRRRV
jgi:protein-L-isoaspartate(D-aspartate) O-methyltransferase